MDNRNCLQWSTAQENTANSKEYQVEKSVDGYTWTRAGNPVPALKGVNINSYTWFDSAVSMPRAMYRIRLLTLDDHYSLSDIVVIALHGNGNLSVYPNPVRDRLYLTSDDVNASIKNVQVYDRFGKPVSQINIGKATTQYNFSTSDLTIGIYTVVIEMEDGSKSAHMIVRQ